jgi:fumarate reductase flavoprotein subunit
MKNILKVSAVLVVCAVCVVLTLAGCENQTEPENQTRSSYNAGEYTGTGQGNKAVKMILSFSETAILTATVGTHNETINDSEWSGASKVRRALDEIPHAIVANQGATGVDAVSGATKTSKGIIEAAEDCIKQAKGEK